MDKFKRFLKCIKNLVPAIVPMLGWLWAITESCQFMQSENIESNSKTTLRKCSRKERMIAGAIDTLIAYLLFLIPSFGWIFAMIFIMVRDGFINKSCSPGKRIMKIVVISTQDSWSPKQAFLRNLLLLLPIMSIIGLVLEFFYLIVTKNPSVLIGDKFGKTEVMSTLKCS